MFRPTIVLLFLLPLTPRLAAEEPSFGGRKLSEWQTMLKEDPTPRKRRAAVVALGQIGADNREVIPVVLVAIGCASLAVAAYFLSAETGPNTAIRIVAIAATTFLAVERQRIA